MKKKIGSSKSIKKMSMGGMNDGPAPKAAANTGSSSMMDKVASGMKSIVNSAPAQAAKKIIKSVKLKNGGSVGKPKMKMGGSMKSKKC